MLVLYSKILTGTKQKWFLPKMGPSCQSNLPDGSHKTLLLKNVISFVLFTNPWSFQIAKDLFIDFFFLPEWNASSYFKLKSSRILTGKSPWKKGGLFHHVHVINKINIHTCNLHHHYLTVPLWESQTFLMVFTCITYISHIPQLK